MNLPPSSRIVLATLPGTVLDVSQRARLPEGTVRARIAELQRAGLVKQAGKRVGHRRRAWWRIYEAAA